MCSAYEITCSVSLLSSLKRHWDFVYRNSEAMLYWEIIESVRMRIREFTVLFECKGHIFLTHPWTVRVWSNYHSSLLTWWLTEWMHVDYQKNKLRMRTCSGISTRSLWYRACSVRTSKSIRTTHKNITWGRAADCVKVMGGARRFIWMHSTTRIGVIKLL